MRRRAKLPALLPTPVGLAFAVAFSLLFLWACTPDANAERLVREYRLKQKLHREQWKEDVHRSPSPVAAGAHTASSHPGVHNSPPPPLLDRTTGHAAPYGNVVTSHPSAALYASLVPFGPNKLELVHRATMFAPLATADITTGQVSSRNVSKSFLA